MMVKPQLLDNTAIRTFTRPVAVILIFLIVFSQPVAAQIDLLRCQVVTQSLLDHKLRADILRPYMTGEFPGPAMDAPGNLSGKVESAVSACATNGGAGVCGDVKRVGRVPVEMGMLMDFSMQTCKITRFDDEVTKEDINLIFTNPYFRAINLAEFNFRERFKRTCDLWNGGGYRDGGPNSPYKEKMINDTKFFAKQHFEAHKAAIKPLDDYNKEHCKDLALKMTVGGLTASCGAPAESAITVEEVDQSVAAITSARISGPNIGSIFAATPRGDLKTLLIRLGDWGRGAITAGTQPFQIGPDQTSYDNDLSGNCFDCCSDETIMNTAYLFGGPNQSVIVGQEDVSLSCSKKEKCGSSSGDPHLCTHDGLGYDFQAAGEFVLAKTGDFEVQTRQEAVGPFYSINTAAAVQIKGDRIAIYRGETPRLTLNGADIVDMEINSFFELPGGAVLRREGNTFRVSADGYVFETTIMGKRIGSVRVRVPSGTMTGGLLGDRNDDPADDIRPDGGNPLLRPVAFDDLYKKFGNSWRVTSKTSRFDYLPGQSAESLVDLSIPRRKTSFRDLNAQTIRTAEAVCRNAGVTNIWILEDCIYDVGLTGDESFAKDAAMQRLPIERLPTTDGSPPLIRSTSVDGVTIEMSSEAIASYPVEITITGPSPKKQFLTFAKVGSVLKSGAGNPYSHAYLKGGDEIVKIRAPYLPGLYELRLMTYPGGREILMSMPFRSITPVAEIEAESIATAGGSIEVRVVGDVSPNSAISIVPVGSPDTMGGPHAFLKGGLVETVEVKFLSKIPGEYEIRYKSDTGGAIYARKKLTIR